MASERLPALRWATRAPLLRVAAALAIVALLGGCGSRTVAPGGSGGGAHASTAPVLRDRDRDVDLLKRTALDNDNDATDVFGPPASAEDRRAILALVARYYALAARGKAAQACAMLAWSAREALIEQDRPTSGRPRSCERILAGLFAAHHGELAEDLAGFRPLTVQVKGNRAVALLLFPARRELRELRLLAQRERGTWKMAVPLDNGSE